MRHIKLIVMSILLGVVSVLFLNFIFDDMNYGLDLQGGFEVLYSVEGINGEEVTDDMMKNTYNTLTKRIDVLGVSEPEITIEGGNTIRVRLAGVTNADEARNTLSSIASLSFRNTDDEILMSNDVLGNPAAKLTYDNYGKPAVLLSVKDTDTFYDVTNELKDAESNLMVIWLDFEEGVNSYSTETYCGSVGTSKCLSAATVNQAFASDVTITGNFELDEAQSLVDLINSGSMPTKLSEIQSKTVSASLGEDSLNKTFVAGVVGIGVIMLLMIVIYRLAGFIASIGMLIYTALVFFIFYNIGGVLTLPGIAAMVLGIGMAIDACVISFERIKEELYMKKDIKTSFNNGMKRSFSTILDANITTLVVAITLFIFGQSNVKGFATMLIISIIVTLIVMVYITRVILKLFTEVVTNKTYFIGASKKKLNSEVPYKSVNKVNFMKNRVIFYILSSVIILVGGVIVYNNGLNLSIDFSGGTNVIVNNSDASIEEVKTTINELYEVEQYSELSDGTYSFRIDKMLSGKSETNDETDSTEEVETNTASIGVETTNTEITTTSEEVKETNEVTELNTHILNKYENAQIEISVVTNIVQKELVKNAALALIIASVVIVIYVSMRYSVSYAIGAIIALIHDVLIVVILFSLLNLEISSIFIAAILTIIGYSINDTIVTFDRIKELLKENPKAKLADMINLGLSSTLTRTLITSITTLIPVISLILLGSYEILNFNIALLIGLISGAYSSFFIATGIFFEIEKRKTNKK